MNRRIVFLSPNYEWQLLAENVDGRILSTPVAGGFVGAFIGMYASSNGQSGTNYADFDWFEYVGLDHRAEFFDTRNETLPMLRYFLTSRLLLSFVLSSCEPSHAAPCHCDSDCSIAYTCCAKSVFSSGEYRNLFKEYLGRTDTEIRAKLDAAWNQLFYGNDDFERVFYPVGQDMAYIEDIGNGDVRTEGMSYGMMIAVQLNKQEEFNRLWKWAKTYMYQSDEPYQGYFAWHCTTDGKKLDSNPASDGEEWFVTALLFASARWGNGTGIFDYQAQAQEILDTMLHKEDQKSDLATNMFNRTNHQVVFVPKIGRDFSFTDPSYHLPAYYELWSRSAKQDQEFWAQAAQTSRGYFQKAAQPSDWSNARLRQF